MDDEFYLVFKRDDMAMPQFKFMITGVVQGVGFRPFVYRAAKKYNIRGIMRNAGNSVELLIQGDLSVLLSCMFR